jgi:hypothetical protein
MNLIKSTINVAIRKTLFICLPLILLPASSELVVSTALALEYSTLTQSVRADRAARYEAFRDFQIKGFCGTARFDLATAYGANTVRTYTPPSRKQLDEYRSMGLKVIVGIWMPHQGENLGKDGKWNYDYHVRGDEQVNSFAETVDRIGDHPAVLLWCLGNEVHLDLPYLETVNRMSVVLHKKHPKQLSSISIVNAPKEKLALIKQHAPDLDVIGYNSYGHGALAGASQSLEKEWGRAYYVSEFGPQGPWWGRKTAWGEVYEQSYDAKLEDLRKSFETINSAPRCLGSTMFLWGCWTQQKPTYFSAFLSPEGDHKPANEQALYITPMAEEFCRYWSGSYPAARAPILTKVSVSGHENLPDAVVRAGELFKVTATATDPDTPTLQLCYRWWILNQNGQAVVGPINTDQPSVELKAPNLPGTNYSVMAYVLTRDQRASGFTVPIRVKDGQSTAANQNKNKREIPN